MFEYDILVILQVAAGEMLDFGSVEQTLKFSADVVRSLVIYHSKYVLTKFVLHDITLFTFEKIIINDFSDFWLQNTYGFICRMLP